MWLVVLTFITNVVLIWMMVNVYLRLKEVEKSENVSRQILNRMIENQRMFVPVIDKVATVAQDIWESRETRAAVLDSHIKQEASLKRIEDRLGEKLD